MKTRQVSSGRRPTGRTRTQSSTRKARVSPAAPGGELERLEHFVRRSRRLLVLTGAGCSTASGIPDYRDRDGNWKRQQPVQYGDFVKRHRVRQRYWARSMVGWEVIATARPNAAHRSLASLESQGFVHHLITQNVDGLHQKAGSERVTDLHGRLDTIECLDCGAIVGREEMQERLLDLNPHWRASGAVVAPDGDADLDDEDFAGFRVPCCAGCAGTLKPSVVFFGESVPRDRADRVAGEVERADAMLVIGSSLMVFSGYRLVRTASRNGIPVAAINLGQTRAEEELSFKLEAPCAEALASLCARLEDGSH